MASGEGQEWYGQQKQVNTPGSRVTYNNTYNLLFMLMLLSRAIYSNLQTTIPHGAMRG